MPGATVQLLGEKHFSGVGPERGAAHPAQTVLFATNHEPVKKVAMWLPATEFCGPARSWHATRYQRALGPATSNRS